LLKNSKEKQSKGGKLKQKSAKAPVNTRQEVANKGPLRKSIGPIDIYFLQNQMHFVHLVGNSYNLLNSLKGGLQNKTLIAEILKNEGVSETDTYSYSVLELYFTTNLKQQEITKLFIISTFPYPTLVRFLSRVSISSGNGHLYSSFSSGSFIFFNPFKKGYKIRHS